MNAPETRLDLTVFELGDLLCGLPNNRIREITNLRHTTPVHLAAPWVTGVVNLRGQIMTVLDLRIRMGLPPPGEDVRRRIVVARGTGEDLGLIVDDVRDVLQADVASLEAPPSHMRPQERRFLEGVLKLEDELVAVLDLDAVLEVESGMGGQQG